MARADIPIFSDREGGRILVIGDVSKAFSDAAGLRQLSIDVHSNVLEAIDAASTNIFAVIAVVMSGSSDNLSSALKALREVSSRAKIILLAQMYEEPSAMQLVGSACNGANAADDYLICPMPAKKFYESVIATDSLDKAYAATTVVVDGGGDMKMKQLEELATTDELTGLRNRRYIWEFCRQIIERARRQDGRVTLLIFDIDNFKHYNDVYSHSAGDEILRQAAVLMCRSCRPHDIVGRIGGDEFAVVFWDDPQRKTFDAEAERRSPIAEHPKEAIFIANRFRRELNKAELHLLGPEGKGVLTISGGLSSFPRDGSTTQELFQQADRALLDAKRSGKNRIYLVGKPTNDIADIK